MSFSQFKNVADVQKAYKIRYAEGIFISAIKVTVPPVLIEDFAFNKENIAKVETAMARF
ncbi:MAG: hypothetical protein V8K32_11410 [Candidatus Electrothrix gigas]